MDSIEQIQHKSEVALRTKNVNKMLNAPHEEKVSRSNALVNEFVDTLALENVFVSTSGGKDSACLSKLCKKLYPNIKHVMFNTGLEYKATVDLAKKQGAEIVPPKIGWVKSCEKHGYPIGSKNISKRLGDIGNTPIGTVLSLFNATYGLSNKWLHLTSKEFVDFKVSGYCCTEFKKKPSHQMKLNPIIGTRIQESQNRRSAWKKSGCNSYSADGKHGVSRPISLWKDSDIEQYIEDEHVELSELYKQYEQKRTGCKICPYGAQIDGSRFDLFKRLEPKAYDYYINHTKLGYILAISGVKIETDEEYMIKEKAMEKRVKAWHKAHKGDDKYLTYKVNLCLSYFTADEIKEALKHIYDKGSTLRYPYEEIIKKVDELNGEGTKANS